MTPAGVAASPARGRRAQLHGDVAWRTGAEHDDLRHGHPDGDGGSGAGADGDEQSATPAVLVVGNQWPELHDHDRCGEWTDGGDQCQ